MQRKSRQREIILGVLKDTKSHPSAEWVYKEVKKVMPNISLGTVYRNLKLLQTTGKVSEISCSGDEGRFDGNPELHYHVTCLKCGKIGDVEDIIFKAIEDTIAEATGFRIVSHCIGFTGICPGCQDNNQRHSVKSV